MRFKCSVLFSWSYQHGLFFFLLYLSLALQISMNGKQDILKQPKANTDLLYFLCLSYYNSSVETNFPIFAIIESLHSCLRINELTCPDNISVMLQVCKKSSAKINHTNHNDARPIITSNEIFAPFQFVLFM